MKNKTSKTISVTTEIELPYYCTDNVCHWYKVFSEEQCIQIHIGADTASIGISHSGLPFSQDEKPKSITESEFNESYNKALSILNKIVQP